MGGTSARAMRRVAEAKKLQICNSRLIAKLRKKKDSLVGLWNKAFVKTVEFVAISVQCLPAIVPSDIVPNRL